MVPCRCASISLQPFDQTCLDCGPLLYTSNASNTCGCLRTRISLQPCVSNTFGLWFCVCVHKSICLRSPLIKHVFQTFFGSWSVYIISLLVFSPLSQTRLILVSYLCTCISLQPCVSNMFGLWILVCVQVSVLSPNGYEWYFLHGSDVNFVFLHVMSGLDYEEGDGHKHGCLDALAITLSLRWKRKKSCNERIFLFCFCIALMY